jgi:iron complex outermembrane receptor protein
MQIKNTITLFIILCCGILGSWAQKTVIQGTITDAKTGEPIMGATIQQKGSSAGAISDMSGKYRLPVDTGAPTIVASFTGYENLSITVEAHIMDTTLANIQLTETSKELGLVVVTGTKYEKDVSEQVVSVEVMKLTTIQNSNSKMTESLNKVPGVNMIGGNISIRGGSGFSDGANTRVLMLLDDIPLVGAENGTIHWDALPLESVEQMEVIKGASSALYGTSALNGVINVRTGNPRSEVPYTKIVANIGGYDHPAEKNYAAWWKRDNQTPMFGGVSLVHRRKFKYFDLSFGLNYLQDQSYLKYNDQKKFRYNIKLRHVFQGKLLGLTVGINHTFSHESGNQYFTWSSFRYKTNTDGSVLSKVDSIIYYPYAKDAFLDRNLTIDPYLTYFNNKGDKHALKFRIFNSKHHEQEVKNSNPDPFGIPVYSINGSPLYSNTIQYYGEYSFTKQIEKIDLNFTTGVAGYYAHIDSKTFNGSHQSKNIGVYIQAEKKFFKRLTISGGGRAEYSMIDDIVAKKEISFNKKKPVFSNVIPVFRFGVNLQASKGTFIRSSIGQGYRFPTSGELFVLTSRAGGKVFPNPTLLPEDGWSTELGIKQAVKLKGWFAYFDLVGYYTHYRNMIDYKLGTYINPNDSTVSFGAQAQNISKATIFGTEASAYGQGKLFGIPFNFIVGYSFTLPFESDTLKNLFASHRSLTDKTAPTLDFRNLHSFKADIEATYKNTTLGISLVYNSFVNRLPSSAAGFAPGILDYRALHHKGSLVFDARISYNLSKKAKLAFIAKNLLNTEYMLRAGFIEAPRNYAMQISYEF